MIHRQISSLERNENTGRRGPRKSTSPAASSPEPISPENDDAVALNLKSDTRQANWRRQNPQKYLAHMAVQRALKSGVLIKCGCEVCGITEADGARIDANHDDYRKPLKVRWLCRTHHSRLHKCGEDLFSKTDATQ